MEPNSEKTIAVLFDKVITLLKENGSDHALWWADLMEKLCDNYINLTHSKTKQDAARDIWRAISGGMGSFSDFLLHKDGKMLDKENDLLAELRTALFLEAELVMYGRLPPRFADAFENNEYTTYEYDVDDYVFYRASYFDKPCGKFFFGTKEDLAEVMDMDPALGAQKMYALKVPEGAVVRYGIVKIDVNGVEHRTGQLYFDKPWGIKDFEILPADQVIEKKRLKPHEKYL